MVQAQSSAFVFVACAVLFACGGQSAAPVPSDHIAGFPLPTDGTADSQVTTINSSSRYSCTVSADARFASTQQLFINMGEQYVVGKSYPVKAGDGAPGYATVRYDSWDQSCNPGTGIHGVSGNVTITAIEASAVSGRYDFTFDNGDRIAAAFTATTCENQPATLTACAP